MSSTSTAIPQSGRHTSHADAPNPLPALLDMSEAMLRASDLQDGIRRALDTLLRWPGAAGGRLTLRTEGSGATELEQHVGTTGPYAIQASSRPMVGPAGCPQPPIVSVELWGAEPADAMTGVCLALAATMLAQAIHVRDLVAENARLRQSLRMADVPSESQPARRRKAPDRPRSLDDAIRACERALLVDALKVAAGNRAKAARLVSTTERIFNYKVRKHGIDWRAFRGERAESSSP